MVECCERFLLLHLLQKTDNVQESRLVVRSGLNQTLGQHLSGSFKSAVSDVTLPKREHLGDEVVLEELHACEDTEHGGLLHPFRKS